MDLRNKDINIEKQLNNMSMHNFTGMFSIFILTLVDSFFLSHYNQESLSAAMFVAPFIFITVTFFIGVSNAKILYFSKRIDYGIKKSTEQSNYLDNIILFVLIIFCFIVYINAENIITLFNPHESIKNLAIDYFKIHYIAIPFCIFNALKTGFLKSQGDSKTNAKTMIMGSIINLILDPNFIIYLDMGVQGAAIATAISWTSSSIFIYILLRYKKELSFKYQKFKNRRNFQFKRLFNINNERLFFNRFIFRINSINIFYIFILFKCNKSL